MRRVENQDVEFVHATRKRPAKLSKAAAIDLNDAAHSA
jgi:hypothetical protein